MVLNGPVIPIGHIRGAVRTLCAGLLRHEIVRGDDWDSAVTTLSRAHAQLGSSTRCHIYATFAATRPDADPDVLPCALEALADELDVPVSGPAAVEQLDFWP